MKKYVFVVSSIFIFAMTCYTIDKSEYKKGPLYGKNLYIPYLIYYNMPSMSASNTDKLSVDYHISTYIVQDFLSYNLPYRPDAGEYLDSEYLASDYESLVTELGVSVSFLSMLQVGIDVRLYAYYGGFIDSIIETFHSIFGFPNAGREYFQKDALYINIRNTNGVRLRLNETCFSFGDIDLWLKYTFFQKKYVSLAAFGAFKIPTGQISKLSGSGYPDIATGIMVDIKPIWIITIYTQAGFVLPFDSLIPSTDTSPYPMFNGMISLEISPLRCFSILGQFSIKSPAISGTSDYMHSRFNNAFPYFSGMQFNTLAGFVWRYKTFIWQFYFEEDTFTWAGSDITLNFMFRHKIQILQKNKNR